MTSSEDLSTPRLMRRYIRELRWMWRHAWWRTSEDYVDYNFRKRRKHVYEERLAALNYSHKLLTDRGWPVPKTST